MKLFCLAECELKAQNGLKILSLSLSLFLYQPNLSFSLLTVGQCPKSRPFKNCSAVKQRTRNDICEESGVGREMRKDGGVDITNRSMLNSDDRR